VGPPAGRGTLIVRRVIGWRSVAVVAGVVAITSSCGTARAGYDPFLIPEEQFQDRVTRLVVAPTIVEAGVDAPEPILLQVDSLVVERLTTAGFFVVPSTKYAELWTRITYEAGGIFDPRTGERDEQRFKAATDQLTRELHDMFGHDAVVYPEIRATEVRIDGWTEVSGLWGVAQWDGVTVRAPFGNDYVNAVSVAVIIEDVDGNQLYECNGGIAVTERWDSDAVEMVRVLSDDVFGEDDRLNRAIDIALRPLDRECKERGPPAGRGLVHGDAPRLPAVYTQTHRVTAPQSSSDTP
jgi:hypothetical protein